MILVFLTSHFSQLFASLGHITNDIMFGYWFTRGALKIWNFCTVTILVIIICGWYYS